jgi:hypothetical protein
MLFGAWRTCRTGEGCGNRPVTGVGRETAKALRPSRDPTEFSRGFGLEGAPGKAGRLRPSVFPKGDRRGFGPDASPGTGTASARPAPEGKWRRDFGSALSDPTGIGEGPHGLSRDPPGPNGAQVSLRNRGKRRGSGSKAIPKPPSERWPRHPATAVKAGTSGGRWRHRPPLRFAPLLAHLALSSRAAGPIVFFRGKARRRKGTKRSPRPNLTGA